MFRPPKTAGPKILLYGAAHLDRVGRSDVPLSMGHSNPGTFANLVGGAAFNVACVLQVLGADVALNTVLGDDSYANIVRNTAHNRGLEVSAQTTDKATATYTSLVQPSGELLVALADMKIYDEYEPDLLALMKLTADDWLCVDANLSPVALKRLLENAPCKIAALSTSTAKAPRLAPHIDKIDLMFANADEFTALAHKTATQTVVTDGALDVTVTNCGQKTTLPVPLSQIKGDVVGAGDALAGATLYGLLSDLSLAEAVKLGIRASECILHVRGPWRADLPEALGLKNESTIA